MKVTIDELKELFDILTDRAIKSGIEEIDIDTDNYWFISSDEREDFKTASPNICVGSLFDDMDSLRKVFNGDNIPTPVDFDRLANVIIAVGERISRSEKVYI